MAWLLKDAPTRMWNVLRVDRGDEALGLVVLKKRAPRQMAAHDEILDAPSVGERRGTHLNVILIRRLRR